MSADVTPREVHQARWNEPVVMELGAPGRRGITFAAPEAEVAAVGPADDLLPSAMRRKSRPVLPEMTEHDTLRHYVRLSQQVLGMVGISLFGTCTMKYNPRVSEALGLRPQMSELHPLQHPATLQGMLEIVWNFEQILKALSGMDRFTFQAAGGADAAYTHVCVTRGWLQATGQLGVRDEIVTSIQAHPCNPATAAAAGFKVISLPLEEGGYPSVEALKAALGPRTAALMINNPDDMGIYNPHMKEWVRLVKEAGGLAFYDHANFNGVMGKIRARDLGFDACMFMLHKTFGGPKGGGGPAVGAYGCTDELARFLPKPIVGRTDSGFTLDVPEASVGKVREFMGNLHIVMRAYAWARGMGADGINEASDISVLANNYMEKGLLAIRGVSKSHPTIDGPRMEMTRYSLGTLKEETGIGVGEVANRMTDYGVDAPWLAHEPWHFPEPFTPEAGELWSKEDIDTWVAVVAKVCEEAYANPDLVKSAPHNAAIAKVQGEGCEDPARWATTWRAYLRKHRGGAQQQAAE
jgi:glycine dehydrogenase subunit 2